MEECTGRLMLNSGSTVKVSEQGEICEQGVFYCNSNEGTSDAETYLLQAQDFEFSCTKGQSLEYSRGYVAMQD